MPPRGLMGKRGLRYVVTDSWEDGTQNWTDDMLAQFKTHRGYDMLPWLPVLTGHVVESSEASDRFLYDFRQTLSDLVAKNHYDQLTALLHARGMGRYCESHEQSRSLIADGMEVKRTADIPMGAMWVPNAGRHPRCRHPGIGVSSPYLRTKPRCGRVVYDGHVERGRGRPRP